MAVTKINGFDAPYRSQTFQNQAQSIVQARGVLKMDGEIATIGGDVQIPPFEMIQNGLIVRETATRTLPAPDQSAPYFIAVSALTPAAEVDDLVFAFPRSPDDISTNQVLLGYWDGLEWRKPQILSIDAIYEDINQQNIDYGRVGPRNGLLTSFVSPNYSTTGGVLVDRQGLRQTLEDTLITPVLPEDVDFNRVDRIIYRRPRDSENRIGMRKLIVGGAHSVTPIGVKETEVLPDTLVNNRVRVLFASTNAAIILTGAGYGVTQTISFTRYSSDRTTEEIAPTVLLSGLNTIDFDAVIDELNNIHVLYINSGNLFYAKFSYAGVALIAPTIVHSSVYVASNVSAFYHMDSKNIFVVTQLLIGVGNHKIYFQSVNGSGGVLTIPVPPKQLTHIAGNLINPNVFVTDDYVVYVACEDFATGRVAFAKYTEAGNIVGTTTVVSDNTTKIGEPLPLVNGAAQAKVLVSDNKEVFVVFRQQYAAFIYGITVWHNGTAVMQELLAPGENFSNYKVCIDDFLNALHFLLVTATDVQYVKLEGQTVQFTYQVDTALSQSVDFCKDKYGALLHVWADAKVSTFTSYHIGDVPMLGDIGAPQSGGYATYKTEDNEFLIQKGAYTPAIGDQVTITGSTGGANDLTCLITGYFSQSWSGLDSHWVIQTDAVFTPEYPSSASGNLQSPDGNAVHFVKTNAELTHLAFRLNVLDSDIILARCVLPGPTILNYGDSSVGPTATSTDKLVLFGKSTIVDWEQTLPGNITITGPGLHVADLVNNVVFDIANGSYALLEDQALYILVDPFNTAVTPQVTDMATLDWSQPTQVLGIIKDGQFVPHALLSAAGFEELDPGEANTVGEDLPDLIRTRLGILSDTQYQLYTSHFNFFPEDDYAIALSKLDALVYGFQFDVGDIEIHEVTNPAGITSYTATKFTWDGSHTRTDIQVYINGKHLTQSLDGSLNYDFHKGDVDRIEFHFVVPLRAEIVIRKERIGGGASGFLKTYYEDTLIQAVTQKLNFTGPGVTCSNGGTGRTNVHIPGGPSFGYACIKSFQNKSGGILASGTAVAFDNDGGLVLADANISSIADFVGIIIAPFAHDAYGDVYKVGNCPGVLAGLGAVPGQLVYLGETPGTLSLSPPSGLSDTILVVGRAEPANATLPDGTANDLYLNPQLISGV